MGIYSNRGFEYLVRVDKTDKKTMHYMLTNYNGRYYPKFDAVSIIDQRFTDDRLVKTKYFQDLELNWFFHANQFAKQLTKEDIEDFKVLEEEKELIQKVSEDSKLQGQSHGWFDVNHVSSTYDL